MNGDAGGGFGRLIWLGVTNSIDAQVTHEDANIPGAVLYSQPQVKNST